MLASGVVLVSCTLMSGLDELSGGEDGAEEPPPGRPDAATADGSPPEGPDDSGVVETGADAGDGATDASIGTCSAPGLVAWWKLDEGSGAAVHDCTGNGLDGILDGGVWVPGRKGEALSFDGGWVGFGDPAKLRLTGPVTAMAWTRLAALAGATAGYIVGKTANASARGWRVANLDANYSLTVGTTGSNGVATATGKAAVGAWAHIAGVYEPGVALRVYVNGKLEGSDTSAVPPNALDVGDELRVGARADGKNPWLGVIDDVRVYDRALSAAEIAQIAAE